MCPVCQRQFPAAQAIQQQVPRPCLATYTSSYRFQGVSHTVTRQLSQALGATSRKAYNRPHVTLSADEQVCIGVQKVCLAGNHWCLTCSSRGLPVIVQACTSESANQEEQLSVPRQHAQAVAHEQAGLSSIAAWIHKSAAALAVVSLLWSTQPAVAAVQVCTRKV